VRTALATFALGALLAGGLASAAATKPTLTVLSLQPVAVRGANFASRERVRVTFVGTQTATVRVRATTAGSFRATFSNVSEDRCTGFAVRAVGARGSRAVLRVLPECAPE
jgi:hypothetical protein